MVKRHSCELWTVTDRLVITAFLQKVKFAASSEKCRDDWWPRTERSTRIKPEELRQSESNGMAVVENIVPEFRGMAVRQKTVHAYLCSRDLCAEVHVSKEQFLPDDQKLFNDVLGTVRLLPDESVQEHQGHDQSNPYLAEGQFYLQHKYSAAAHRYQKALDLEKQGRTLDKTRLRVLVDNLGMSYGLTGKHFKAEETFKYGLSPGRGIAVVLLPIGLYIWRDGQDGRKPGATAAGIPVQGQRNSGRIATGSFAGRVISQVRSGQEIP
jgi:hypothetical protein